jgi:hypothetical protein
MTYPHLKSKASFWVMQNAAKGNQNTSKKLCRQYRTGGTSHYFMRDIATGNMKKIETKLWTKINEVFPSDRYKVVMTGKALFLKRNKIPAR